MMQTPTLRPQTERSQLSAPCQQDTDANQAGSVLVLHRQGDVV